MHVVDSYTSKQHYMNLNYTLSVDSYADRAMDDHVDSVLKTMNHRPELQSKKRWQVVLQRRESSDLARKPLSFDCLKEIKAKGDLLGAIVEAVDRESSTMKELESLSKDRSSRA